MKKEYKLSDREVLTIVNSLKQQAMLVSGEAKMRIQAIIGKFDNGGREFHYSSDNPKKPLKGAKA